MAREIKGRAGGRGQRGAGGARYEGAVERRNGAAGDCGVGAVVSTKTCAMLLVTAAMFFAWGASEWVRSLDRQCPPTAAAKVPTHGKVRL